MAWLTRVAVVWACTALAPARADACCCGADNDVTLASCRTSARVFAGTVAGYRWPDAFDEVAAAVSREEPGDVELDVDQVWRGDVPSVVVSGARTPRGGCGIAPLPGTTFVACDDGTGGATVDFGSCGHPSFDDPALAAALDTELGPPRAPRHAVLLPWRWRPRRAMAIPCGALAVGLLVSAWRRRRARAVPVPPLRGRPVVLAALAYAAATVALRVVAHVAHVPWLTALGPVALATSLGLAVGLAARRRGPIPRVVVAGLLGIALITGLGYRAPHLPSGADAVACSQQRAETYLRGLSGAELRGLRELDRDAFADAMSRAPHACTDAGLARFDPLRSGGDLCLSFDDGDGGRWWVCRDDDLVVTHLDAEPLW